MESHPPLETAGGFKLSDTSSFSVGENDGNGPRPRKRPRAVQACERCRGKKYKCDELYPACSQCTSESQRKVSTGRPEPANSYVRALEGRVEELVARLQSFEGGTAATTSAHVPAAAASQMKSPPSTGPRLHTPASEQPADGLLGAPPAAPRATFQDSAGDATTSPHGSEITGVNEHTNEIEFHGNTSSIAFLGDLERFPGARATDAPSPQRSSLVSAMHNRAFARRLLQPAIPPPLAQPGPQRFYAPQAHIFIEAYFSGIHYMHPFINKARFLERANALWFEQTPRPANTFIAMYLSLLALGALTRSWPEESLGGYTRFEWSRKLFNEALMYLPPLHPSNDLETVHCLYLMAKICQNELTPHLAWTFLGRVIRTCISAGFNRDTPNLSPQRSQELSRTWWGLFSLEVEMSFSLGRPDTLGLDEYHNIALPEKDMTEFAIIPCMVDLARIIRKVSLFYAALPPTCTEKIERALQLEAELDAWLLGLPLWIRPETPHHRLASALREPEWCRRHRLVLELRYHNVKLALFRSFIDLCASNTLAGDNPSSDLLYQCANKCVASAQRTIELVYDTFKVHEYFRTWWYNTTYIMVATAALLSYIKRVRSGPVSSLVRWVEMAMEILDAMDESVVARKCAEILRAHLKEVEDTRNMLVSSVPIGIVDGRTGMGMQPPLTGMEVSFRDQTLTHKHFSDKSTLQGNPSMEYQIFDYSLEDMASFFEGLNDVILD
ncbi:hypothetical protein GQ53DRAFT_732448 [Thozetella sp. PMI_491]|nr:hypothetical protein GQ53DRAFT_732448 [Thozetella sp. PMI_491]